MNYKYIRTDFCLLLCLFSLACGFYIGYNLKQCDTIIETKVEYRDSIVYRDTTTKKLFSGKVAKKETKKHLHIKTPKPIQIDSNTYRIMPYPIHNINLMFDTLQSQVNKKADKLQCLDTNIYWRENYEPDSFRATTYAEVAGNELLRLDVTYQNLKPETIRIIERTNTIQKKQALLKVFAGAYARTSFTQSNVANFGGGLSLDAVISDNHLIGLNGGLNSNLQGELGVRYSAKIKIKK